MKILSELSNLISAFDLIYIVITILSLIKCFRKGFVLSIFAASKWLLAYVLTLFFFPKFRPYVDELVDNDYILDIVLAVSIFIIIIFVIILFNKGIKKAVTYSGIGTTDKIFGFFFGFVRSYVIAVCLFTTINFIVNYERWSINLEKSITFEWVEKGSKYLIKEFPSQKEYKNAKDKIEDI